MAKSASLDRYIHYAYGVNPELTKEVIGVPRTQYELSEKQLKFVIDDIGEKLLPLFDVKDLVATLSTEDRLKGLSREDQEQLLRQLRKNLGK